MKAWLHAQNQAKPDRFGYGLVFSRAEAAEMTEHDAHEVMRGAELDHSGYSWKMVNVPGGDLFVVEGTKK
jgi:hypothetical protein